MIMLVLRRGASDSARASAFVDSDNATDTDMICYSSASDSDGVVMTVYYVSFI
jgi:hypothetical protein